ncbi:MAG: T9SS type B sorting domain-containing protein [Flavisolibacter sp.]
MKKWIAFSVFLMGIHHMAMADHITGGEMFYTYLGGGTNGNLYAVTLKLFMRCNSGRRFNDPTTVAVFDRVTNQRIMDLSVGLTRKENISLPSTANPCITNPPMVCYDVGYYEFNVSLPPSPDGYLLVSQVNYRIAGISNLEPGYGLIGATYTAEIPGTLVFPHAPENNSARFSGSDLVVVCAHNPFSYSFGAVDPDGDLLHYTFCQAYVSGTNGINVSPPPPPYAPVPYGQDFAAYAPLGTRVQLDPHSGLISGIAPGPGVYVVTVCVEEIRGGEVIAIQRKDLQINITECTLAAASLLPEYQLCTTSSNLYLENLSGSPLIHSYQWQLLNSQGGMLAASTLPSFSYAFADTGLYLIRLYTNLGQPCSDSASSQVRVYPGLAAAFDFSGICFHKPTLFQDHSQTVYGHIIGWHWDFGEETTMADTSDKKDPVYLYTRMGVQTASLVVTTTTGCRDTLSREVTILDKPPLELAFLDTLICKGDSLRLHAAGEGSFSWTPALNMGDSATAAPLVHPQLTTQYVVQLNDNGCINTDSVRVRVVNFVDLVPGADTLICAHDSATLYAMTNGLKFGWTPFTGLADPAQLSPRASPAVTTTYTLTASIGHCAATASMKVKVVPYPTVDAGSDTLICFNSACRLHGLTDGSQFSWSPSGSLEAANTLVPLASPQQSTAYVLAAFDTLGCPKPARDTVLVRVLPRIYPSAGHDTAVVEGQPLQLAASGGAAYVWFPSFNLSSDSVANPVAVFHEGVDGLRYGVRVYNEAGCVDSAFLTIRVFASSPVVFVPNAFTPNQDGKNDVLRPVAAGMVNLEYFRVYNRWGQLIFSTTTNGKGWDGRIGGKEQGTGTYVWEVKATDYKGGVYLRKGLVTLIR